MCVEQNFRNLLCVRWKDDTFGVAALQVAGVA
jgi:hypothetical protein